MILGRLVFITGVFSEIFTNRMINICMSHTAFKYRLNPTKEQITWLEKAAGSNRWLWNYMLDLNKKEYDSTKKFVFAVDMSNKLPVLKKEHLWLRDGPSQSLQQTCINLA